MITYKEIIDAFKEIDDTVEYWRLHDAFNTMADFGLIAEDTWHKAIKEADKYCSVLFE